MSKYIFNDSGVQKTYVGVPIENQAFFAIPAVMLATYSENVTLLTDILSGVVKMSSDGSTVISSAAEGLNFIKNMSAISATVSSIPAFGSKTFIHTDGTLKKLYARNTGVQQALSTGANTISYTLTYPWAKIIGVEVVNAQALDYVDLKIKDTAAGLYSGIPNYVLNQFAYAHNIPKDYYIRMAQFDADMYVGMIAEITYNSVSAKTVGINFILNEVKS